MAFLKSALAGLATAFLVMIVSIVLLIVVPVMFESSPLGGDDNSSGSSGIGAVSAGVSEVTGLLILSLSAAGFALGFWWQFKRGGQPYLIEE